MRLSVSFPAVLAVAGFGGFALEARAQPAPDAPTPLIEVYGTLVPFLEYSHTTGATAPGAPGRATQVAAFTGVNAPARFRMDVGTSDIGFRGGIDLTDDLSVVWQIESGVPVDGAQVANTIASRNTHVGVKSPWGTLVAANWDTPYKWATLTTVNPLAAGFIPDYTGILSNPGFGVTAVVTQPGRVNGPNDAGFERRQGNSLQYWSPLWNGVTVRLAYSIDEGRTPTTPVAPSIKPSLFSSWLGYENGWLTLRYTFEAHFDYFGMSQLGGSPGDTNTNRSSTDTGNRLVAQYLHRAPGFNTRALGVFEYLSYNNDDTTPNAVSAHSRAAVYGLVEQTLFGKHHVWLALGQAFAGSCSIVGGAACSTSGLGANDVALGYLYRASPTTDFFAVAYRISNDTSASYSTFPPLAPTAPGADVSGIGVGMLYSFVGTVSRGSHRAKAPGESPPPPVTAPDLAPSNAPPPGAPPVPPPSSPPAP